MGEKQDANQTGEDLDRKRAWDYSIEDTENWDKKQEKKGRRADTGFAGQFKAGSSSAPGSREGVADNCEWRRTQTTMTRPGESTNA